MFSPQVFKWCTNVRLAARKTEFIGNSRVQIHKKNSELTFSDSNNDPVIVKVIDILVTVIYYN